MQQNYFRVQYLLTSLNFPPPNRMIIYFNYYNNHLNLIGIGISINSRNYSDNLHSSRLMFSLKIWIPTVVLTNRT